MGGHSVSHALHWLWSPRKPQGSRAQATFRRPVRSLPVRYAWTTARTHSFRGERRKAAGPKLGADGFVLRLRDFWFSAFLPPFKPTPKRASPETRERQTQIKGKLFWPRPTPLPASHTCTADTGTAVRCGAPVGRSRRGARYAGKGAAPTPASFLRSPRPPTPR